VAIPSLPSTGGMPKPPTPPESDVTRVKPTPSVVAGEEDIQVGSRVLVVAFDPAPPLDFSRGSSGPCIQEETRCMRLFFSQRRIVHERVKVCVCSVGVAFHFSFSASPTRLTVTRPFSERAMQLLRSTLRPPSGARRRPSGWLRGLRLCGCPLEWRTTFRDRG